MKLFMVYMHKPAIFHSARVGGYLILEQKVSSLSCCWCTLASSSRVSVLEGGGGNQYLYFITLSEITRNGLVTTWIRDTEFCARIN